jgi:cystine transport system substrate-binding protein
MRKRLLGMTLCLILLVPSIGTVFAEDKKTDYDAEIKAAQNKASGIQSELETSLTAVNEVYKRHMRVSKLLRMGKAKLMI